MIGAQTFHCCLGAALVALTLGCSSRVPVSPRCEAEADAQLCASRGAECGLLSAIDRCGAKREVTCGGCEEPMTCGTGDFQNRCSCEAETDEELCAENPSCEPLEVVDACGRTRQMRCNPCEAGALCTRTGAGCRCKPFEDLCLDRGLQCGEAAFSDSCGGELRVECGQCPAGQICGAWGAPNVCGCAPELPQDFCTRVGKDCGLVFGPDSCGVARTVDCGSCPSLQLCGAGGTENQCGAPVCVGDGFCWQNPLPQGNTLRGIWGSSRQDVWAVGDSGTLLRWDGARWALAQGPTSASLRGVWGSSASDVWAVGADSTEQGVITHFDGGQWNVVPGLQVPSLDGVAGASASDGWAVGEAGTLLRLRAGGWQPHSSPTSQRLKSVAVFPSGQAMAAGLGGLFTFDGTTWSRASQDDWPWEYEWVGGRSEADYWVASRSRFCRVHPPAATSCSSNMIPEYRFDIVRVFSANPQEAWIAWTMLYDYQSPPTSRSYIGRYVDGASDMSVLADSGQRVRGLWGAVADDVWAVGDFGTLMRWDGREWKNANRSTVQELRAIAVAAPDDAWAVGRNETLLHFTGDRWKAAARPAGDWPEPWSVSMAGRGAAWGLSQMTEGHFLSPPDHRQTTISRLTGGTWQLAGRVDFDLNAIWAASPDEAWAVGDQGTLARCNPSCASVPSPTQASLKAVWGSSPRDVWASGESGTLVHFDGTSWSKVASPAGQAAVVSLWGASANEVWAVAVIPNATSSTLMRWDGTAWTAFEQPPVVLRAVCGAGADDVWAVGKAGAMMRRRLGSWSTVTSGVGHDLNACAALPGAGVWVVGQGGAILHRGP